MPFVPFDVMFLLFSLLYWREEKQMDWDMFDCNDVKSQLTHICYSSQALRHNKKMS